HRVKLRNLQQVLHSLGEVEQLQLAAPVGHRGEGRHQLPDSRAVDVRYLSQVEQDLLLALTHHFAQAVAQCAGTLTQGDPPRHIHHAHVADLPNIQLYAHRTFLQAESFRFYLDTMYLTKVTSVPAGS